MKRVIYAAFNDTFVEHQMRILLNGQLVFLNLDVNEFISDNIDKFRDAISKLIIEKADVAYLYMNNDDVIHGHEKHLLSLIETITPYLNDKNEIFILGCSHYLSEKQKFAEDNNFKFIQTECRGTTFLFNMMKKLKGK
jgi:hypothetical protein